MIPALSRLLELARKATPGKWVVTAGYEDDAYLVRRVVDPLTYNSPGYIDNAQVTVLPDTTVVGCGGEYRLGRGEDLAYIAALSPELVAALVKVAESADHYRLHQALCVDELPRDHLHCDYLLMDDALREALDELRRAAGGET